VRAAHCTHCTHCTLHTLHTAVGRRLPPHPYLSTTYYPISCHRLAHHISTSSHQHIITSSHHHIRLYLSSGVSGAGAGSPSASAAEISIVLGGTGPFFECFPYVCPEPVLANARFSVPNDFDSPANRREREALRLLAERAGELPRELVQPEECVRDDCVKQGRVPPAERTSRLFNCSGYRYYVCPEPVLANTMFRFLVDYKMALQRRTL
jgi:hypothetical protein